MARTLDDIAADLRDTNAAYTAACRTFNHAHTTARNAALGGSKDGAIRAWNNAAQAAAEMVEIDDLYVRLVAEERHARAGQVAA